MQFIVSFNETDPNGRNQGLRKLVFDAPWYDRTLMHERLAFPIFEARGLPYSCVNSTRLNINGAYYGLFTNVERLDKEYRNVTSKLRSGRRQPVTRRVELKPKRRDHDRSDIEALRAATTVA